MPVLAESDLQIWYKFENGDVDPTTKVITNHVSNPASYITGTANANICPITTSHSKRGSGSIDLTLSDNNTFINLPSIDFSQLTSWTISIWYKMPANNTSNSLKDIVSFFASTNSWNTSIFNEIHYNGQHIRVGLNGYGDFSTGVTLNADNIWHHYCISYSNGIATYYLDASSFYTKNTTFTTNTVNNFIGRNPGNDPSDTGITSYIDDFRFYSTGLTSSQVSDLYNIDDTVSGDTPTYNVPDSSTITNAISGSTATLSTISTDDLTDTTVIGTTTTEQRNYTKNLLASLITSYTTELSGKQLKLSGITLPGFANSGDKDIIVVSTAANSTLDNTVSKSDITSNNVYAVIETNESISLPTHTSTLTVAKTGDTTYDITFNGTTTVSNTGDTITQDGLTVILGSVMANLSVQNVDLLFTNHLAESITAAAATIPGFTTTMTADATVECTGPAATVFQNTFYFKTDSDIATDATDDVHYFVDLLPWSTIAADLNASTNGTISLANGAFVEGESISESFLRHLANTLFGTHLGVDLFNNETTVKDDLLTSTAAVATTIQTAITDVSVSGSDADLLGSAGSKYLDDNTTSTKNITREMVNQLLNNPNSRERFNASNLASYNRDGQAGYYNVPFLPDDTISYKVTINPNATQDTDVPVGPNTTARSFRVKMKLT